MRKLNIPLIILIISSFSCKNTNENSVETTIEEPQFVQKYGNLFFDYDEIEFYHINYDENKNNVLIPKKLKSKNEELKYDIILGDFPYDLNDLDFISKLEKIGFEKKVIEKSNFKKINEIFIEKRANKPLFMKCIPIYRDFLIFKKKGKVIGTSKICFSCLQNQINGTKANTENFGQDGDYEKLKQILNN